MVETNIIHKKHFKKEKKIVLERRRKLFYSVYINHYLRIKDIVYICKQY
jgi:hypothetical protein